MAYTQQSFTINNETDVAVSGLGIPIHLRFNMIDHRKFYAYAQTGLLLEQVFNSPSAAIGQIFSMNTALGGDYVLFKQWQLFAQFGINKEFIKVVETPLYPVIQFGLRYQIEK